MAEKSWLVNLLLANRAPEFSCPDPPGSCTGQRERLKGDCGLCREAGLIPAIPASQTCRILPPPCPPSAGMWLGPGPIPAGCPSPQRGQSCRRTPPPPHRHGGDRRTPPGDEERDRQRDSICWEVQAGALPLLPPSAVPSPVPPSPSPSPAIPCGAGLRCSRPPPGQRRGPPWPGGVWGARAPEHRGQRPSRSAPRAAPPRFGSAGPARCGTARPARSPPDRGARCSSPPLAGFPRPEEAAAGGAGRGWSRPGAGRRWERPPGRQSPPDSPHGRGSLPISVPPMEPPGFAEPAGPCRRRRESLPLFPPLREAPTGHGQPGQGFLVPAPISAEGTEPGPLRAAPARIHSRLLGTQEASCPHRGCSG